MGENDGDEQKNDDGDEKDKVVSRAVHGIFTAIQNPDEWPEDAKNWMRKMIAEKDIEQVIEDTVRGSAKGGHHGLGNATEEELKKAIARIGQRKEEFKEIAEKNFAASTSIFEEKE